MEELEWLIPVIVCIFLFAFCQSYILCFLSVYYNYILDIMEILFFHAFYVLIKSNLSFSPLLWIFVFQLESPTQDYIHFPKVFSNKFILFLCCFTL